MNILLIDPPFYRLFGFYNRYFPLGITAIGTFLRNLEHTVTVYDADFNEKATEIDYTLLPQKYRQYLNSFRDENNRVWNEVRKTIETIRPDMVGISIWTTYAASAYHAAKISKQINPECAVVMGGPHASVRADEILRISPEVDYVIRGEGEFAMAEVAYCIEHGLSGLTSIQGLSYKMGAEIRHNASRPRAVDLDRFPFPDRALLVNEMQYSSEDMGLIMTGRGCPFHCTYCSTDTRRVSYRSIDNVLSEIRLVKDRYGTTQFSFKDDSFTVDRKRVEEFCDRIINGR